MDKAVAQARQVQAQEATAQGVVEILERLAAIEEKVDRLLATKKGGMQKAAGQSDNEAGA